MVGGILSGPVDGPRRTAALYPVIEATFGVAVEHAASRFRGVICGFEPEGVRLRGSTGDERLFRLHPGAFRVQHELVTLRRRLQPTGRSPHTTSVDKTSSSIGRTASGSLPVPGLKAKVALASRIWVEGVHDAELVEKIWGDDLRVEGVVVERLDGIDRLGDAVSRFAPGPGRRLGVLVDHLVGSSKEARIAASLRHGHVLVTGTPYVDVWQAVHPRLVGLDAWPSVPRGEDWKRGTLARIGRADDDPGRFWKHLLGKVESYADLNPALVGAVESLIDFVTAPGG